MLICAPFISINSKSLIHLAYKGVKISTHRTSKKVKLMRVLSESLTARNCIILTNISEGKGFFVLSCN